MGVYVLHQICLSAFDHITDTSVHITTSSGMIVNIYLLGMCSKGERT